MVQELRAKGIYNDYEIIPIEEIKNNIFSLKNDISLEDAIHFIDVKLGDKYYEEDESRGLYTIYTRFAGIIYDRDYNAFGGCMTREKLYFQVLKNTTISLEPEVIDEIKISIDSLQKYDLEKLIKIY